MDHSVVLFYAVSRSTVQPRRRMDRDFTLQLSRTSDRNDIYLIQFSTFLGVSLEER